MKVTRFVPKFVKSVLKSLDSKIAPLMREPVPDYPRALIKEIREPEGKTKTVGYSLVCETKLPFDFPQNRGEICSIRVPVTEDQSRTYQVDELVWVKQTNVLSETIEQENQNAVNRLRLHTNVIDKFFLFFITDEEDAMEGERVRREKQATARKELEQMRKIYKEVAPA